MKPRVIGGLALLASIGVAGDSRSATQSAQAPPVQIQPAVAEVVIVDVYVTDSKNRPVTDLRKEDFELREDAKPVAITAFQAPPALPAEEASGRAPAGGKATGAPSPPGEPFTLAIYVDRWLLSGPGRKRALDQAAVLAESHIARGAQVVVIAEEKGLRPLTPLTADPAVVRAALVRVQGWATQAPAENEARQALDSMKSRIELAENKLECSIPPCLCVLPDLLAMARSYATLRGVEVQQAAARLSFLVASLRGLPGQKALVYVSEGLEERPGLHLYDQLTTICPEALTRDASTIYGAMQEIDASSVLYQTVARANAARVTFYPIDARGLTTLSSADISAGDRRYVASARNDGVKDANLVNQYHYLADKTGGFAILRGLDPAAAMKRFDADARGHYVLGFVPEAADGRTHSLFVDLNEKVRKGRALDIRHRESYVRAPAPARRAERALSALLFGLENDGLRAQVSVERSSPEKARVQVTLPLSSLRPLEGLVPLEGRAQIVLSFRRIGDAENQVTMREKAVTYSLAPDDLARDSGPREIVIDVPVSADGYEFAVGIEDVSSGASTYARRTLSAINP